MTPFQDESYIRMSTKEMIHALDRKIDRLDEKVDSLIVAQAALPAVYVTQDQVTANHREAVIAKRYAITAIISSVGIVVTGLIALV